MRRSAGRYATTFLRFAPRCFTHATSTWASFRHSITWKRADYRLVPGVGIGSRGPVASVALFSRVPLEDIRRIALDSSSRTSVALVKVLCRHRFHIAPEFASHGPHLDVMTRDSDAALLIGDPALEADHEALGLLKIDLGAEWTAMTGLPFVYAAWTGRAGAISPRDVRLLQAAQEDVGAVAGGDRHGVRTWRRRRRGTGSHVSKR